MSRQLHFNHSALDSHKSFLFPFKGNLSWLISDKPYWVSLLQSSYSVTQWLSVHMSLQQSWCFMNKPSFPAGTDP